MDLFQRFPRRDRATKSYQRIPFGAGSQAQASPTLQRGWRPRRASFELPSIVRRTASSWWPG
jgi:hypothetical protein